MNPKQLEAKIAEVHAEARRRLLTTGAEQYYDPVTDKQLMEKLSIAELLQHKREEAQDLINYCGFVVVRLDELEVELRARGIDCDTRRS